MLSQTTKKTTLSLGSLFLYSKKIHTILIDATSIICNKYYAASYLMKCYFCRDIVDPAVVDLIVLQLPVLTMLISFS